MLRAVLFTALISLASVTVVEAQTLASALNVWVFPTEGQTAEQQSIDEAACYQWATQTTGLDPFDLKRDAQQQELTAEQARQQAQQAGAGAAAGGAVAGAATGALIGGVLGNDAGRGAAWGAGLGALSGRGARRQAQQQATQAVEQQAQRAQQLNEQQQEDFNNAFTVCLEAKDYMVRF